MKTRWILSLSCIISKPIFSGSKHIMATAIASHFNFSVILSHLHISTAGHLSEVLLLLQGFVNLVIRHAEAAQSGFNWVVGLCKDDELGHVRDTDDLSVHLSGEVD